MCTLWDFTHSAAPQLCQRPDLIVHFSARPEACCSLSWRGVEILLEYGKGATNKGLRQADEIRR
jgi:hypothetical protein